MKKTTLFHGWKMLAAVWMIVAVTSGFTYYGGNIMNSYMAVEIHLDRKSLGLAFGMFGLCMGLTVPLSAYCVHRWGIRPTLSAGALLAGLGALAMAAIVDTMPGVLVAYSLVMGVGSTLSGMLPAQTLITRWFTKRLAMALAIMLSGTTAGGIAAAPLFEKIIVALDGSWRAGWLAMAAACFLACLVAMLFVRDTPAGIGQLVGGEKNHRQFNPEVPVRAAAGVYRTSEPWKFRETMRQPVWWLLALGTVCFLAPFGMMVGHGVVHFKGLGYTAGAASAFLGLLPFASLGGQTVVAIWGDRIEPRFLWSGAMVSMALGMIVAVTATSDGELYGAAFLIGSGCGASYPCMITLVANYFGKSAYASLMGAMLLIAALAAAAGPILAGVIFDGLGSYAMAFYPAAAACLLAGAVLPFARPPLWEGGPAEEKSNFSGMA